MKLLLKTFDSRSENVPKGKTVEWVVNEFLKTVNVYSLNSVVWIDDYGKTIKLTQVMISVFYYAEKD